MPEIEQREELLELTARIVEAHVSNNPIAVTDLPSIIATVREALAAIGTDGAAAKAEPAVPIKKSVRPDYIVCLEDGRKLKTLKRHLREAYGMSPNEYRAKWSLPSDYPMTAPKYAELRSKLAKEIGLGRKPGTKVKRRRKA